MRSRSANLTTRSSEALLKGNRPGLIHRPGDGTLLWADRSFRTARTCNLLLLVGCSNRSFTGVEARPVGQHAVQHHSELAGERDLYLAHARAGSQAHRVLRAASSASATVDSVV